MAGQFSNNLSLSITNGNYTDSYRLAYSVTQNNFGVNAEIVSVPTSATTYSFSNLTTYGITLIQNLDATNYVEYGISVSSVFQPFGKIKAGETHLLRLFPGITFQMLANTAAVNIFVSCWQD